MIWPTSTTETAMLAPQNANTHSYHSIVITSIWGGTRAPPPCLRLRRGP